jgi:S1-C subfamily serine protease
MSLSEKLPAVWRRRMSRTEPSETPPTGRARSWRPVLWVLLGAVLAVAAVAIVDGAGSSGSEQTAPSTTGPTTTTLAPPVAEKVYRTIRPSLVLIQADAADGTTSLGSGVIVNRDGEVLTADHVVQGATTIKLTFADGTSTSAQVADAQPERDTATLQPDQPPSVVVPAVLGGGVKVGDDTYSVGNPLGLVDSLTSGVVSGLDRSIQKEDGTGSLDGLIQFDAAVNPGSSGGPLLNRQAQVVGIVTALANPSGQRFFVGIGFAVPLTGGAGGGDGSGGRVPQS